MESRRRRPATDHLFLKQPDFSNLEVRGIWTGNADEPVDLQISLEVQATPNTQLQLLNLRPAYISLLKTSVHPKLDDWNEDLNSTAGNTPPRSPLFAFSGPPSFDEEYDEDVVDEEEDFYGSDEGEDGGGSTLPGSACTWVPHLESVKEESVPLSLGRDDSPTGLRASRSESGRGTRRTRRYSPRRYGIIDRVPTCPPSNASESEFGTPESEAKVSDQGLVDVSTALGEENTDTEGDEEDEGSEQETTYEDVGSRIPSYSFVVHDSVEKSEDYVVPKHLGKRNATEAFLSNLEATDKREHRKRMSSDMSHVVESDEDAGSTDLIDRPKKHSRKPSSIPRPVSSIGKAASEPAFTGLQLDGIADDMQQTGINGGAHAGKVTASSDSHPEIVDATTDLAPYTAHGDFVVDLGKEIDIEGTLHTQSKVASDELLMSDSTDDDTAPEEDSDEQSPAKPSESTLRTLTDEVQSPLKENHESRSHAVIKSRTPEIARDSPRRLDVREEDSDDPGSPTPVKPPRLPPSLTAAPPKRPSPSRSDPPRHEQALSQHVDKPQLDWTDGILIMINSRLADSGTYKIAITVSVNLQKGKLKGWDDLIVPGLPRSKDGESGYFLFLLPKDQGMEFRTTNFCRHRFVEDCFFAEFTTPGDLVVPLRTCDPKFYGIIKDFTVEQEIRSDLLIHGERVGLTYNAMCSLKLHNRCFYAEGCCFFLYVEGGPEGDYQCRVEHAGTPFPMFRLKSNGVTRPIGVSHVQITCPSKALEAFCLTWKVDSIVKQKSRWLPRIYPESANLYGRERLLRQKFTELLDPAGEKETIGSVDDGNRSDRPAEPQPRQPPVLAPARPQNRGARRLGRRTDRPERLDVLRGESLMRLLLGFLVLARVWNAFMVSDSTPRVNEQSVSKEQRPFEYDRVMDGVCEVSMVYWLCFADEDGVESEVQDEEMDHEEMDQEDMHNEPSEPSPAATTANITTVNYSVRDRIDYLLGWRGP